MEYDLNNIYSNLYSPLEQKIYNENNENKSQNIDYNNNNKQIYNFNYNIKNSEFDINNNNIFGLNFHQDEENDENEIINSLHFSKYNMNNSNYMNNNNNYEQKIKNNKNIIANNINIQNSLLNDEEPFEISASKYTESNFDNRNIFNNSKINNNFIENQNNNNNVKNNIISSLKKISKKNVPIPNNQISNISKKSHSNLIKHNLILNNNYYINNNNSNITNNKNIPIIVNRKSFSSKRRENPQKPPLNKNQEQEKEKMNYNSLHNYYKIPKQNINKNIYNKNTFNTELNQKNKIKINNNYKYNNNTFRMNSLNRNKIINANKNNSNIIKEENYKKIYSKRQKAELDMVRGCFIYDKKYFNFDIKNGNNTINYIKFIKPTEPILQINYKNVDKFYPLIRKKFDPELNFINPENVIQKNQQKYSSNISEDINEIQNINSNNEPQIQNNFTHNEIKNKNNLINLYNKSKLQKNNYPKKSYTKKNLTYDFDNQVFNLNANTNINYTNNNNDINDINKNKDKDGISFSLKKKIYDWLVDIDIIKDKIIKIESLPTLCINGVLLCDLINRCEGKNEILKGIIRRTNTRSQIQVNINKVLEYLRTLEKFPARNLWSNIEISKGNNLIIWQLLDDIYNFYGNKITFNKRYKKGFKNNNINKFNNNDTESNYMNKTYNNYTDINNTPTKNKKMNTLNTNKSNISNNNRLKYLNQNNDINNEYINNNFSKHSYTPDYYNKIQRRKRNLNVNLINDNINNLDNNINENKFIYDNSKKILHHLNKNDAYNPYNLTNESSNRNKLNHTNDNFYESKMFSMDTSLDKNNQKKSNINNNNINNKIFNKNLDISSISSDRYLNIQKNNKSFSVNNGAFNKNRKNKNFGNNQSFYSTNLENNRKFKGGFLLFEKASINKLKEKIGKFNTCNMNDLDTLDIKNI